MDNLYFGSGILFHFRKWDARPTILLFGSGTLVPPLFRFDGTEVPFPKSLKNQLVSRFFVTFYKKSK